MATATVGTEHAGEGEVGETMRGLDSQAPGRQGVEAGRDEGFGKSNATRALAQMRNLAMTH